MGYAALQALHAQYEVAYVFTDRQSLAIHEYCTAAGLPVFMGNPRGGRARDVLPAARCDVLLSINYLFLVEEDILAVANRYAINLHGSLLPKYRGRTPHVWAIINGEKETGVTAHLMTPALDAGDIVGQRSLNIRPDMTGADILAAYQNMYPQLLGEVLNKIAADTLTLQAQDETRATYFPKRTPEDGRINWGWSRERVRNWVRAQAPPYPGAYFEVNGNRVTVHYAFPSSLGFRHEQPDGTLLAVVGSDLEVKLADGVLRIGPVPDGTSLRSLIGKTLS
ncbi:methionyl-tRNA formyltransferase [Lewinella sp. IMCC34191]|uniref:methionyl-tRNA formyltransferase n=1 Tax=Lewinella sp. IMCC34191 TaxID=2259172 RepID=UPI0018E502FE|nr:methionyl-tRNA formyltransferase [Lewinella sp. IMCC34191]